MTYTARYRNKTVTSDHMFNNSLEMEIAIFSQISYPLGDTLNDEDWITKTNTIFLKLN